ncbi:MAG TPA: nicotinamide-nucleotide amidohydrolase family protein [Chlamydiales bacterium]|nr:nicotinamide-nucleotide amidohydrolase family protein [Chlamydiales bacterium]
MKLQIIAIGTELLTGMVQEKNSSMIAKNFAKIGIETEKIVVVADDETLIVKELQKALCEVDFVVLTGGLGPTLDDNTSKFVASFLQKSLIVDEKVLKDLNQRFPGNETNQNQSQIIEKAVSFRNIVGIAPGQLIQKDRKWIALLPGVVRECEYLVEERLIPYLCDNEIALMPLKYEQVHLCLVSEPEVDQVLRKLSEKFSNLNFGIYPGLGIVKVVISGKENILHIEQEIAAAKKSLEKEFETFVFESDKADLAESIHKLFIENDQSLSCAESCSGGTLSSRITALPGSSKYFLASIVAYANSAKEKILGVEQVDLEEYGAVSKEVATSMVLNIVEKTGSDFGIAITGIAGPTGGTEEKPVGTVYIAVYKKGEQVDVGKIYMPKDRESIVQYCVNVALAILYRKMRYNLQHFG